ncbi:DsbA family protein [Microbacterium telephonicum]|uniref:Protein-disulfide isomerase n=1 Tax=Microbacterium telephonicum TaxID=1714841 RepID=A0A498C4C2_9MICO|nr:thioredoxin domain-containing protein [Microbacterium telephonicum]RLK47401.1 protein-disulfide isomerase [Microbacterium telephonicum]
MSDDDSTNEPERDRREVLREKAQLVHVKQSRARLARRSALVLAAVAAVAVVAVVVTWVVGSAASRPQLSPENTSEDGFAVSSISGAVQGMSAPDPDAAEPAPTDEAPAAEATPTATATAKPPVEIRVYVDYLSPAAREWQIANVQQLSSWVGQGAVTLTYHPVSMLTAKSNGTKYSLRAAGAAACVATYSPDTFFAYNNELLSKQPAVDSDGFTDKELASLAIASGVEDPKKVRACIEEESFSTWVKSATERAISGIPDTDDIALTGTPTVLVNGQQYVGSLSDPAEFSQFVLTSASDAFYKTQTASPTPTATPTP